MCVIADMCHKCYSLAKYVLGRRKCCKFFGGHHVVVIILFLVALSYRDDPVIVIIATATCLAGCLGGLLNVNRNIILDLLKGRSL